MSGHVDLWQPHTCECCLATTEGFYKDIAAEYYWMGRKEVYEDMLLFVFNITIDTGQQEHRICEMCIQKLRNSFNFKRQVLESQKKLLVKSVDAESLSFKETSSLDIKLDVSTWQDDSTDANSEPLCVGRATSLDIKLEDSPICQDDSNIELSVTLEEDNNISSLSIENVIPDAVENAKRRTLKRLRGSPSENSSLLTGNTADTSPQGLCDTFGNDNNSSSLKISNEIPDAVNKAKRRKRRRPIKTQKQPPSEDSYLHTESVEDISPQGALAKGTAIQETREKQLRHNTVKLMRNSNNIIPFKWHKNKYQCFCCKHTANDIKTLKEHMMEHRWMEIKNIVTRYNSILFHKVDISALTCKFCSQSQTSIQELREHLSENHSVEFKNERDLLIPFNLGDKFQCVICQEEFLAFHRLNIHMNVHYQNYICETCGAGFTNQSNLREHSTRHQPNQNVACEKCNLDFANRYHKDQHDIMAHKKGPARKCPYCGERFNEHYKRLRHMISVHGEKAPEFKCNLCDRVYLKRYLLNAHTRKFHIKETSYQCEYCPSQFFYKYDLSQHLATHRGGGTFVCSVCGKFYTNRNSFRNHSKTHTATS